MELEIILMQEDIAKCLDLFVDVPSYRPTGSRGRAPHAAASRRQAPPAAACVAVAAAPALARAPAAPALQTVHKKTLVNGTLVKEELRRGAKKLVKGYVNGNLKSLALYVNGVLKQRTLLYGESVRRICYKLDDVNII